MIKKFLADYWKALWSNDTSINGHLRILWMTLVLQVCVSILCVGLCLIAVLIDCVFKVVT